MKLELLFNNLSNCKLRCDLCLLLFLSPLNTVAVSLVAESRLQVVRWLLLFLRVICVLLLALLKHLSPEFVFLAWQYYILQEVFIEKRLAWLRWASRVPS